jgi:hypothetical protein
MKLCENEWQTDLKIRGKKMNNFVIWWGKVVEGENLLLFSLNNEIMWKWTTDRLKEVKDE